MTLRWYLILPLLLPLILGACASTGPEPLTKSADSPPMVWPAAPEPARIEFVKSFTGAEDLGLKKSFWEKLVEFFAGAEDRRMTRPYAIAANNEKIAVADPDASAVHLFDLKRNKYRKLDSAGKHDFVSPIGVALGNDRLFIADSALNKVFVLDENLRTLIVLNEFRRPTGLAFDQQRLRLYVADTLAHQVKVFDQNGQLQKIIGENGEKDGQFNFPSHIAFGDDQLFVNDTMNFRIQRFQPDGTHLKTFGKQGNVSGSFGQSKGVAIDPDGHVYVADSLAGRIQIFDQNGILLLGLGSLGGAVGSFQLPAGLTFWQDKLFVADSYNGRIQMFRYLEEGN